MSGNRPRSRRKRSSEQDFRTDLVSIWRRHEDGGSAPSRGGYLALARGLLAQGEPLLAYDVIAAAVAIWPSEIRFKQLQALALARSGAIGRANVLLEQLRRSGAKDEETLGLLGRTYKDLALEAVGSRRKELLQRAAAIYEQAYKTTGGYWSGINAATMNLLIGEQERACRIATKVRRQCSKQVKDPRGDQYWELAALGEAALICREWTEAKDWYARAGQERKNRFGDLQSSRRNASLILDYWRKDESEIEKYLNIPPVIVFAGHMIDRPEREPPRFPPNLEREVAAMLDRTLTKLRPGFGFASAACGSDILFIEAMLRLGAEVAIVLPYEKAEFVSDSVDFVPQSNWRARFERVLKRARRVVTASNQRLKIGGVSYEFCNEILLGLAAIRARELETQLIPVAVWNGQTGDGPGGAATVVQNWRSLGLEPIVINLPEISPRGPKFRRARKTKHRRGRSQNSTLSGFRSRIVAILFADAVGFSKLSESEVPRFVEDFLGAIADLTRRFRNSILAKNTWGDGLYFVFSDAGSAGRFGLEVAEVAAKTKWQEKGLPAEMNLRIGLHAGPAYEFDDPVTDHRTYGGAHVSRAARIEPITPPGQVYASEAFAALAAAQRAPDFTCDYVGLTPLAKNYGTLPTYHVRRTTRHVS